MTDDIRNRLPLSRHAHDRQAERRSDPELLTRLLADSSTLVVVLSGGKALIENDKLARFSPDHLSEQLSHHETMVMFLGSDQDKSSYVAAVVSTDISENISETASYVDLKLAGEVLNEVDAGLYTQALALSNWHRSYQYSPRSGKNVIPGESGWVRHHEGAPEQQVFPRTDPAVIVIVTDDEDRILLGNNALWEPNRYSLLAGFVEPGESLEAAAVREVFEESGLVVTAPTYLASQPWPFPQSLMIGFHVKVAAGHDPNAVRADGEEIRDLRWFTRDELKASVGEIAFPGKVAIARIIIENWLGEPLDATVPWQTETS